MTASSHRLRRIVGLGVFSAVIVGVLLSLGVWQLQRRVAKHLLMATLHERLAMAPVPLPMPAQWPMLTQAHDEFRRVTFSAVFKPAPDAHVFSSGSAVRPDVTTPGVWVFAPAHVADGPELVINRGFVPEGRQGDITPPPSGAAELTGYIRFPETEGMLIPHEDRNKRLWFLRDQQSMARVLGWGDVAPFYIDLESPVPANGLPKPGPLNVHLKDDHMQYAITWFGLAAAVGIAFAFWLARAFAEGAPPPPDGNRRHA